MDAEIPQLGPGSEPADVPVWGTSDGIPVKISLSKDIDGGQEKNYNQGIFQ